MRSLFLTTMVLMTGLLVSCFDEEINPTDGTGDQDHPTIGFDTSKTSIFSGDTIHFDSGTVTLVGNSENSKFQVKVDGDSWTDWEYAKAYTFNSIDDGEHMLYLRTRFSGDSEIVEDSMPFYVKVAGYRPEVTDTADTSISITVDSNVVIICKATGADTMYYQWYKDSSLLRYATAETLSMESAIARDAGVYYCVVTNKYGIDTGRVITLSVLVSQGGITGVVADKVKKIKLTVWLAHQRRCMIIVRVIFSI